MSVKTSQPSGDATVSSSPTISLTQVIQKNLMQAERTLNSSAQGIKQLDNSFLMRMKELGNELITQLKPACKRPATEEGDERMES
eukprot:4473830-Amphidinium_carterae.1